MTTSTILAPTPLPTPVTDATNSYLSNLPAVLTPESDVLCVVGGRAWRVKIQKDDVSSPPWVDRDGAGVLFQRRTDPTRAAGAGCENIGHGWVFDYQATYDKAVAENWGPDPTAATDAERDYCMGWCDGTWWHVGWILYDDQMGHVDSCWGYESDCMEHVREAVADALAQQWRIGEVP